MERNLCSKTNEKIGGILKKWFQACRWGVTNEPQWKIGLIILKEFSSRAGGQADNNCKIL